MGRKNVTAATLAALGAILSTPAQADTKAGVDAWTRGDPAAAVREWQAAADQGDADALFNLGQAYKLGQGVPRDLARAERLFAQAAQRGHLQAGDNYGLLLFQRGDKAGALPYLRAAADRGDPRAQYLVGLMHFNGELVPKDWVRAYALVSLARQQGLAPAADALVQMDAHIPLDQRQKGVALSAELQAQADATRARQLASVDLASGSPLPAAPMPASPPRTVPSSSPALAGADFARPATLRPPHTKPAAAVAPAPPAAASGPWRLQFGAFGQRANADALWNRVRSRPEVAGHPRLNVNAGAVTKLQAGGYASQAQAQAACAKLRAAGFECVVVSG